MKRTRYMLVLVITMVCRNAGAVDAYFVRFNAQHQTTAGNLIWLDDILLYNMAPTPVVARFVGVSNGSPQADLPLLTLPPGQTVSLNATQAVNEKWRPIPVPLLWVLHLDIPNDVVVESRDEYYSSFGVPELFFPIALGKVSMPIFRELAPAGKPQVHLGTDLSANDSRLNVMIYNGGSGSAIATIEVRRTCDSALMDSRTITIAANTLVQTGSLAAGASETCTSQNTASWMRYTVVTVSQPSLTFVSNLNESLRSVPGEPIVGLGITKNQSF